MRFIIPLRLENHTLVIHLHKINGTSAVGKSYPSLSINGSRGYDFTLLYNEIHSKKYETKVDERALIKYEIHTTGSAI